MRLLTAGWLVLLVLLAGGAALAAAPHPLKGVALVIGETGYVRLPVLANPDKDARDIDHMLDDLGFEVTRALDVRSGQLREKIDSFLDDARGADVALIYYAGHGIEAGGKDYIIGTDADISTAAAANDTLVSLDDTLARLKAVVPITIMLLDACRTNPFTGQQTLDLTDDSAPVPIGQQGLEIMRGPTPAGGGKVGEGLGMVIGFSASPGQSALDGPAGENSPYASALLQHLSAGGYSFGDIMTMVTQEVYVDTGARQLPWTSSSLSKILYFGRDADQPVGEDAAILGDRRKLLLDIASVPEESKADVETVAAQENLKLADLYSMLDIINGGKAQKGPTPRSLLDVAKRVRDVLDDPILSGAPTDPELARLDALANKAIAAGAFKRAFDYRQLEARRAAEIEKSLDLQQADIDAQRKELAGVYARVAEAAMYALKPDAENDAYKRAAAQSDLFDKSTSVKLRLRAANAIADRSTRQMDLRGALTAIAVYQDILKEVDATSSPALWADTQLRMGETMREAAGRQGDGGLRTSALVAARAALTVFKPDGDFRRWSRAERLLARSLANAGEVAAAVRVLTQLLKATPKDKYPVDWGQGEEDLGELYFQEGALDMEANVALLDQASDAYGAAAAADAGYDRGKMWSATLRRTNAQVQIAIRTHDEKLARSAIATAVTTLAQFTDHDPFWGNSLIDLGGSQIAAGIAFGDDKLVQAGLASYATAEKTVITEKTSRFDWGLARIAEGDALRFLGLRTPRNDKLLRAAIVAYEAGAEAMTGIDAGPHNAPYAHYKAVRLQSLLGEAVRPEDRALANLPPPAALNLDNASVVLKNGDVRADVEGFLASIVGATLDGRAVNFSFYLYTVYQDTSDPQRNIIVLRLQFDATKLSDPADKTIDVSDCGDVAGWGGEVWLNYGLDSMSDLCVLSKMTPKDAALLEAVRVDLRGLVHKAALAGDVNAARIDPLFAMMPLRQ